MNCILCGDTGYLNGDLCWGCNFDYCPQCGFAIIPKTTCPKCRIKTCKECDLFPCMVSMPCDLAANKMCDHGIKKSIDIE